MAMIFNYGIFHWLDKNGLTAQSFLVTQDQSSGSESALLPLAAAAQDCCAAAIVAVQMVTTTLIDATPADGPYKTVYDRGVLLNRITATNRGARQSLVGPDSAIFLPGNRIIDLSNPQVVAYQSQVMALLGDEAGNTAGAFIRGNRQVASRG